MDWLLKHWWILVLVFLVGVLLNVIKDLKRVDHKKFLANKPDLRRTAILTISGTMTTTGRRTTRRRNRKFASSPNPRPGGALRGYINSTILSSFGLPPLSASSK